VVLGLWAPYSTPRPPVPVNTLRAIAETTGSARELYDEVVALYPDRINPDVVWISAQAVKPSQSGQ
jgi:hypothetical protein